MALNILYWNCASGLLKKPDFIKGFLDPSKVDIFLVAEAKFGKDCDPGVLSINGYDAIFSKTIDSKGRA